MEIRSAIKPDGTILRAVDEVSSGHAHFGIGAADILIARDRGDDLAVTAVIFQESAAAFYSLEDTPILSPKDLVDLKVARNVNDLIDVELQAMLRAEGIDPDLIAPFRHETGTRHLTDRRVDVIPGYSISFPFEMSSLGIEFNELKPFSVGVDFYGDSLFTTNDLINSEPELVESFTAASLKGWKYALENSAEIAGRISAELPRTAGLADIKGFNLFQIDRVFELTHLPYVALGNINPARWTSMHNHLKESGLVSGSLDLDSFIFDPELAEIRKVESINMFMGRLIPVLITVLVLSLFSIIALRLILKSKTRSLAGSEARYRDISESMPAFVCRFDTNYNITYVNRAYCESMKTAADELLGQSIFHNIADDDVRTVRQSLMNLSGKSPIVTIENKILDSNGDICWQRWTNRAILDRNGSISEYQSIGEDITESKVKEKLQSEKLKLLDYAESHTVEEILRKILDVAEAMTFSEIGFFHFINEDEGTVYLQTWSSRTLEKYCQITDFNQHYPIDSAGIWLDSLKTRQPVVHNDYAAVPHKQGLPEGHVPLVRELLVPVFKNDKIVALLGVGNKKIDYKDSDIYIVQTLADHVWSTVVRINAEEKLRESRNNLRITLNSIGDGVIAVDKNWIVSQMNPVAEKLTGWSFGEAEGLSIEEVMNITPVDSYDSDNTSAFSSEGISHQFINSILVSRHDEAFRISCKSSPIIDDKKGTAGYVIVFRDISEEMALQEQLVHKSKMDAVGQLSGGIAHDFNNMLSGIMNAAQLLKLTARNLDEKSLSYTDVIMQASVRAAELISKLMAFSRKEELNTRVIDLHSIIDETVSLLDKTINKNIKISVAKNSKNSRIRGEHSSLQSVLMNICINGSHAMPDGGTLEISTKDVALSESYCEISPFDIQPGSYCDLEILDTGIGIAEENLNRVFEPFFTTKEQGMGTGLGLSVVYGVIQAHKGEIKVYSEPGTGTAFHILLPYSQDSETAISADGQIVRGSGTVLLVDDEEILRIVGGEMLHDLGYNVLLAENGLEAVEIYKDNREDIDLVIIDMIMPEMDGKTAFQKLRKIDSDCKVLMASGYTRNENLNDLLEQGLSGFIKKPFIIEDLSKLISKILIIR